MKKYRKAVADAFALQQVLMYLSERAEDMESSAEDFHRRASDNDSESQYYMESAGEYEAKSAAFERLLEKLAK